MGTFSDRLMRAARLDANLYEEVEADKHTMGQATAVVLLSSLAAGIGRVSSAGTEGIIIAILAALIAWYVWAYLTYFIGTRVLPEPQTSANLGELLRTIGFASSPGLIRVFGIIPPLRVFVFAVAAVWMLAAMVIAVRQALDYTSTWRAIGVCAIGWVIQTLVLAIILYWLGAPAVPPA